MMMMKKKKKIVLGKEVVRIRDVSMWLGSCPGAVLISMSRTIQLGLLLSVHNTASVAWQLPFS